MQIKGGAVPADSLNVNWKVWGRLPLERLG